MKYLSSDLGKQAGGKATKAKIQKNTLDTCHFLLQLLSFKSASSTVESPQLQNSTSAEHSHLACRVCGHHNRECLAEQYGSVLVLQGLNYVFLVRIYTRSSCLPQEYPNNMAVVYFDVDALQDKFLDKGCTLKQKFPILGQLVILQVWCNEVWIILSASSNFNRKFEECSYFAID